MTKSYLKEEVLLNQPANARLDSLKALPIRFETKAYHWRVIHSLAFAGRLIRKRNKKRKL